MGSTAILDCLHGPGAPRRTTRCQRLRWAWRARGFITADRFSGWSGITTSDRARPMDRAAGHKRISQASSSECETGPLSRIRASVYLDQSPELSFISKTLCAAGALPSRRCKHEDEVALALAVFDHKMRFLQSLIIQTTIDQQLGQVPALPLRRAKRLYLGVLASSGVDSQGERASERRERKRPYRAPRKRLRDRMPW